MSEASAEARAGSRAGVRREPRTRRTGAGIPGARWLPTLVIGLPLVWLVAVPLAILAISALKPTGFLLDDGFTLANLRETYSDAHFWSLIGRTLHFAVGSTLVALAFGISLAFVIERSDLAHRDLARLLLLLPMAMPPFLVAMGWTLLASPRTGALNLWLMQTMGLAAPPLNIYSIWGMIFVEGLSLTPSAFLILAPALRNFDAALEEAASMSGANTRALLTRIVLPLLVPSLAGAAIYLVIVSCMVYDVPGTIGMPAGVELLSTYIYDLLNHSPTGLPEYGPTSAVALLVIVALTLLGLVYQRLMANAGRYVTITGKAFRPRPFRLGRLSPFAGGFVALYLLLSVVAPIGTLVWSSFLPYLMPFSAESISLATTANYESVFAEAGVLRALGNSLVIATVSASIVALLALAISWVVLRTRAPLRGLIDLLAFLPLAMPGVLVGTALIYVYLTARWAPVYGTIWIIAIAHVTVYLSFGTRTTNAAVAQIHTDHEEAARMSGAGLWVIARRVLAPLAAPALGAVWIWVFAHSLRELSAALMLQGASNRTVTTLLFGFWSQGQPTKAAAIGVGLAGGLVLLILLHQVVQAIARRRDG